MLLLASPLWFLSGGWADPSFPLGSYCQDCGDRINFLGLVLWALAILGNIFLAIVLLA